MEVLPVSSTIEVLHTRGISEEDLLCQVKSILSFVEIRTNQPIGRYLDTVTAIVAQKLLHDVSLLERFLDATSADVQLGIVANFFNEVAISEKMNDVVAVIRDGVERIIPGLVSSPVITATRDSRRVEYAVRGPIEQEIDKQEKAWYAELRNKLEFCGDTALNPDDIIAKFSVLREDGFDAQKEFLAGYLDAHTVDSFMQRMPIRVNIGNSFPYTRLSPAFIEALEARLLTTDDSGQVHLSLDPLMPYSSSRGLPELAPLVHEKLVERGIAHPNEPFAEWIERFVPSNGSSEAIAMTFDVLVEEHDDVVMTGRANYSLYSAQIKRRGANERTVPYEGGDITVESVLKALTPRTRLLIINSPNNPGGYIGKKELIEVVAEALRINGSKQVTVLFDEAYGGMTFGDKVEDDLPARMVALCPDQVIA
ncbi:MAG: aminotransferase class I/II-fold pyridoxal phosphate-dependent enzyme, partial [Candidatus Gracilibacteria bacterium]